MAVAREAKKVDIEIPAAFWPEPLWESRALPTLAVLDGVDDILRECYCMLCALWLKPGILDRDTLSRLHRQARTQTRTERAADDGVWEMGGWME